MARHRAMRAIDGVLGETRRLGLVGDGEAGGEAGLERELAQQRVAERVDGADGDVADAIAQRQPALAARRRSRRRRGAASSMIRSRISAAALRVKVMARMLAGSTPTLSRLT